jgi:lysophospholipase L1-like esterase
MISKNQTSVLIIGDSITLGVAESRGQIVTQYVDVTYVHYLREMCPELCLHVRAVPFWTTKAAREILNSLLVTIRPEIVLLMLGGNDADIDWRRFILSGGRIIQNNVSVTLFGENLRQILREVIAVGATPVLVDVPNHDLAIRGEWLSRICGQDVMSMIATSGGQPESDRRQFEYNQIVRDLADEFEAHIAGWGKAIESLPTTQRFGPDCVHPGSKAHRVIANTIAPVLTRLARRISGRSSTSSATSSGKDRAAVSRSR